MNTKNGLLYLSISLALNSTREEVLEAIDGICDTFNIDMAGTVAPAALVEGATPPQGVITLASVELDSQGLPWDERIHSSNKAKVADGSWRAKRGCDPALKTKVEKALLATVATTPAAPPAPPAPPAPAVAAVNPAYAAFVSFIAEQTAAGAVDASWIKTSLVNFGVANGDMQNLAHNPELIPPIEAAIRTALGL